MIVGLTAVLALSGCAAGQVSQTADQVAAIDGANVTVGEIGVRNALLQTPDGPKWAAGSDVALLFWLTNDGTTADTLTQVSTAGAKSVEISGKATIEGQSRKQFGADSQVTVTVKGLTADMTYGQTLPLTFVFTTAGQVTANVPVQVPDERTGARDTVDIQPTEPGSVWGGSAEAHGAGETGADGSATAPAASSSAAESSVTTSG